MSKWTEFRNKYKAELIAFGAGLLLGALSAVGVQNAMGASFTVDCGAGVTGTWNAASNTVTCVKDGTTPPTTPPNPIPGDPFAGCPANALKIDGKWGQTRIETSGFGGQVMSIRVAPPVGWASTSSKTTSWVEYVDGPVVRHAVFSTVPCDFSTANALRTGSGAAMVSKDQIRFSFVYRNGAAGTSSVGLTPGKVYFINVRNTFGDGTPSCSGKCDMSGGLPQ